MNTYTFEEAKQGVADALAALKAQNIHPYSVDFLGEHKGEVGVQVDVFDFEDRSVALPGWYGLGPRARDQEFFLHLVCGFYRFIDSPWRERIAAWGWTDPQQWERERKAWRCDKFVVMPLEMAEDVRRHRREYQQLKRKWALVLEAVGTDVAADRPAKRARVVKDAAAVKEQRPDEDRDM